jgi:hypothetical protein
MYHKSDPVESAAVEKHVKNMITRALEMDGTSTASAISAFPHYLFEADFIFRVSILSDSSRSMNCSRKLDQTRWPL